MTNIVIRSQNADRLRWIAINEPDNPQTDVRKTLRRVFDEPCGKPLTPRQGWERAGRIIRVERAGQLRHRRTVAVVVAQFDDILCFDPQFRFDILAATVMICDPLILIRRDEETFETQPNQRPVELRRHVLAFVDHQVRSISGRVSTFHEIQDGGPVDRPVPTHCVRVPPRQILPAALPEFPAEPPLPGGA